MAIGLSYAHPFNYGKDEAVAWSPSNLTLYGWWDASDTGSITQSLGAASQINDLSGNSEHITQGTGANQPATGSRTQNGLNVLDFDGSNDYMNNATQAIPASGNVMFSGAWVIDSVGGSNESIFSANATNDFQLQANNNVQFDGASLLEGIGTSHNWTGGPYSGLIIVQFVLDWGTGNITTYVGGSSVGTSADYTTNKLDASQDLILMTNRSASQWLDGAFCEMFISEEVDASSRASAYTYLSDKWTP